MIIKKFLQNKKNTRKAFSMIELAIVILIIGILIAGVIVGNHLYKKSILTTARSLARNSPVASIPGLTFWIESTLEESFKDGESSNGAVLTAWYDINNRTTTKTILTPAGSPIYDDSAVNRIPCVKFDGTANTYFSFDGSFLVNTDYTIMVVEQRASSASNNFFISKTTTSPVSNQNILLGYSSDNKVLHSQNNVTDASNTNAYAASVVSFSTPKPKVMIFVSSADPNVGKKIYINGALVATSTNTDLISPSADFSTLYLGRNYNGSICEVAIFKRAIPETDIRKTSQFFQAQDYFVAEELTSPREIKLGFRD